MNQKEKQTDFDLVSLLETIIFSAPTHAGFDTSQSRIDLKFVYELFSKTGGSSSYQQYILT
jgi:hypothetical protein